jgi:hypothetical protein
VLSGVVVVRTVVSVAELACRELGTGECSYGGFREIPRHLAPEQPATVVVGFDKEMRRTTAKPIQAPILARMQRNGL